MKLCIILPSQAQKSQAGVRIRYTRLKSVLEAGENSLEFISVDDFNVKKCTHDVYLISKCYDARIYIIANILNQLNKPVGIDLFDDYFSQIEDSRFSRLRYWFKTLVQFSSFILCSTENIRSVAQQYARSLPVHVMNDPSEHFDSSQLLNTLENKLDALIQTNTLKIVWFGIGDNPNFPVGLADLAYFSNHLESLRGHEYTVSLTILTNKRALTVDAIHALQKIPIAYSIEEWSEEAEKELLNEALVCFLPVNFQPFSRVKSLNRAVTALVSGTQVLSSGFSLYEPLEDIIYRDVSQFTTDLKRKKLLLSADSIERFTALIGNFAQLDNEATKLLQFLNSIVGSSVSKKGYEQLGLLHGSAPLGTIHKFAQKQGALSVALPVGYAKLFYNVIFQINKTATHLNVFVRKDSMEFVSESTKKDFVVDDSFMENKYLRLDEQRSTIDTKVNFGHLIQDNTIATIAASYRGMIDTVNIILEQLFPTLQTIISENSKKLPWPTEIAIDKKSVNEVVEHVG